MNPLVLKILRYSGALLGLAIVQMSFSELISIRGIHPDFLLIGVIFIALREGQLWATVAGFAAGLVVDLTVGELVGISALAKTVAGFAAGYFFDEQRSTVFHQQYRFIGIVALGGAIHGLLSYTLYIHRFEAAIISELLVFTIGATLYTMVFATAMVLIAAKTSTRIKVS